MITDICGIEYTVKYIEPNSREDTFMGRSDPQKAEITINKSMAIDIQEQCLIHEWLHAVLGNYCLEETNNEHLVQALASELYRNGFKVKPKLNKKVVKEWKKTKKEYCLSCDDGNKGVKR